MSSPLLHLSLHLESFINQFFFKLRSHLKLSRRNYQETPCLDLSRGTVRRAPTTLRRITALKQKYDVAFEKIFDETNTLENYHFLDLLDQAKTKLNFHPDAYQKIIDVGCKNFFYAGALHTFFKPDKLIGIEIDAYKMYHNGHTRFSYATHYIQNFKNTEFIANDFLNVMERVDGITMFLPFVTEFPLVKWSLPLTLLKPQQIFHHAHKILNPQGWLLMMNQNKEESLIAKEFANAAGFTLKAGFSCREPLMPRPAFPQVSWWRK